MLIVLLAVETFIDSQSRVFDTATATLLMLLVAAAVGMVMLVGAVKSQVREYAAVSLAAVVIVAALDQLIGSTTVVSLGARDVLMLAAAYCAGVVVWGVRPGTVVAARFASLFLLAGAGILGAWSFTHLGTIDQPVFAHIIFTITLIVAVLMGASEDQGWIGAVAGLQGILGAAALISESWGPVLHATGAMVLAGCLGIAWAQEYVMPENRPWSPLPDDDKTE
ncbi:MAG: hypothetical protein SPI77_04570 [Corynebacterium sp.]|nr:hypothetical protein [Corynebacterium sp.]